jgi:hypothetical protein
MQMTQKDFDERQARTQAGTDTDEDRRLLKQYAEQGYEPKPTPADGRAPESDGGGVRRLSDGERDGQVVRQGDTADANHSSNRVAAVNSPATSPAADRREQAAETARADKTADKTANTSSTEDKPAADAKPARGSRTAK